MKNLNIGVFHDDSIAKELGKKGTESDFLVFNKKTGDCIYTFLVPRDDKLSAKAQIMSVIDAAVVSFSEMTPQVGETIVMLDNFGVKSGVVVMLPETVLSSRVATMTKGTALENYHISDNKLQDILENLNKISPQRDTGSPVRVMIDHSFSVKGVGEVVLGFVTKGTVKKYDKLALLPAGKEIVVRSIQMHDKDFDEAPTGSRVGLCIKGAVVEEMKRGSVLCAPGSARCDKKLKLSFEPNKFYKPGPKEGPYHVCVGMQFVPVKISEVSQSSLVIESEKPLVHSSGDTFLLLDINAEKMHVIGRCTV